MYKKLLVGYDGSDNSKRALQHAIQLAKLHSAKLVAVEAIDMDHFVLEGYYREDHVKIRERISTHTQEIKRISQENGVDIEFKVGRGPPDLVISKIAEEEDVDLVVLGTRGHRGLKKVFLGSVSSAVAERTKKPILVVK
ncbi:universal stress protein [Metallosphaera hakonensis]|uniref:Universal stress protein n=1 Tax=Metallosphaera hakonensis JCM 8857 = DSM 7519 TaxID=1293036 RepID=A0A2U9IRE4_9CREN|nr:universal stress protein [Metallosphaera hakonensis]AWR98537.1 universal stress protein [Metallosphaera hakonensis JCM 8857 = DSM 7519]